MRSKLTSRMLAALLAVVMVVGLLPMTALAARVDRDDAPVAEAAMGEEAVTAPVRAPSKAAEVAEVEETETQEKTRYYFETPGNMPWKIGDGSGGTNTVSDFDDKPDMANVTTIKDVGNYRAWAAGGFLNFDLVNGEILAQQAKTGASSPCFHVKKQESDTYIISYEHTNGTTYYLTAENREYNGQTRAVFSPNEADAVPYFIEATAAGAVTYRIYCEGPYTVNFNVGYDGAETIASLEGVYYGTTLPAPADREGYTFLGWFDGETKYTEVTADVTLTAKWKVDSGYTPEEAIADGKTVTYLAFTGGTNQSRWWDAANEAGNTTKIQLYVASGVDSSSTTTLDTDGITAGNYVINFDTGNSGKQAVMHYSNGVTNQCSAVNVTCGSNGPLHLFVFEKAEDNTAINAFTIKAYNTTKYLSLEASGNQRAFKDDKTVFYVTPVNEDYDGTYYIWTATEPEPTTETTPLTFLSPDNVEEGYEAKYLSFGSTGWNMSSAAYAVKLYELVDPAGAVTSNSDLQAATAPVLEGRYAIARSGNEHLMHFTAHGASNHTEYTNQCGFNNSKLGGCAEGHLAAFEAVAGKENAYRIHGVLDTGNNHYVSTELDPAAVNGNNGSPIEELKLTAEGAEFFISPVEGQSGSYYIWTAVEIRTPGPEDLAQTVFTGTSTDGPFNEGQTNSTFRIPALVTLDNGWIVAAADIRWPDTADSPNNLDTIVSVSKDGGETWDWEVVNYFSDFAALYGVGRKWYSASFIDPALAVDGDGTLWMAVDLQPAHVNLGQNAQKTGSGFDENGYLMVGPISESEWETKVNTSLGRNEATRLQYQAYYEYRVDINSVDHTTDVTTTKNGKTVSLYPVFHKDTGATNGYYVDAFFDLYYDHGEGGIKPVLVAQKESDKYTQANLFYVQSPWKAYSTTYLMIRKATVNEEDGKLDWGDPQLVSGVKNFDGETFLAFCPGRGTVTTVNGKERVIFPVYDNVSGEKCSVVYTDDGGATWTRGARIPTGGVGKTSESQIVVLPDGNGGTFLRIYSRNTVGKISYADSEDGGATWTASQADDELKYGDNVMVSFINLKGYLLNEDGTIYGNLILGSYPWGTKVNGEHNRSNGVVRIGTFDPETKDVTWLNENEIRYPGRYNYSCLTQLLDEDNKPTDGFGLLYEVDGGKGMLIPYVSLTTADLMGEGWTLVQELPAIPSVESTIVREEGTASVIAEAGVLDLDMGATGALTATVTYTEGKQDDAPAVVEWSSSDERVATVSTQTAQASLLSGEEVVNEQAVITAVGPGRAVITATVIKNGVTSKASETEVVVQDKDNITVPDRYQNEVAAGDEDGTYTVSAEGLSAMIEAGGDAVKAADYAKTLALANTTYTDKAKADEAKAQIDEAAKNLYAALTGRAYYTIGAIGDRSYTGEAIEPPVIVRKNGAIIAEGYTLEYVNNVDVGTATVNVKVGEDIVTTGAFGILADDTDEIVDNSGSSIGSGSTGGSATRYPAPAEEDLDDLDVPLAQLPMTFEDVKADDWFYEAAEFVFAQDMMLGVSATEFRPTMNTTRGMVVTILHRMAQEPEADPATFADVASTAWYGPAVAWGAQSKVVQGAEDGDFHPMDAVTREQLAVFLYRFAEYNGYDVSARGELSGYADSEVISSWAKEAMSWAVGTGLITGKDGNVLAPLSAATRAELAVLLTRFCKTVAEEK